MTMAADAKTTIQELLVQRITELENTLLLARIDAYEAWTTVASYGKVAPSKEELDYIAHRQKMARIALGEK